MQEFITMQWCLTITGRGSIETGTGTTGPPSPEAGTTGGRNPARRAVAPATTAGGHSAHRWDPRR
jgi:hypothetical protein